MIIACILLPFLLSATGKQKTKYDEGLTNIVYTLVFMSALFAMLACIFSIPLTSAVNQVQKKGRYKNRSRMAMERGGLRHVKGGLGGDVEK